MHYLVTGGSGFIGSHLASRLLDRGDRVTVLDNLSTGRSQNIEPIRDNPRFRFVHGSVLDTTLVEELVSSVDVIAHLAAAVGVKLIIDQALKSLITNIRGSEIVLDAAWKRGIKTLMVSSSEIYGKSSAVPLTETTDRILGPPSVARWAYSTSKAVEEILALAYHRERDLPVVIVRLFNTVGPRQTSRYGMVLPRFVEQALAGTDLTVYGDGSQTRCFCYVDDAVEALVLLLDDDRANGEIFNVGNSEEISIEELARLVISKCQSESAIELIPYDQAYEQGFEDMLRRVPDSSKIGELLGWSPKAMLDEMLDRMIDHVRSEAWTKG